MGFSTTGSVSMVICICLVSHAITHVADTLTGRQARGSQELHANLYSEVKCVFPFFHPSSTNTKNVSILISLCYHNLTKGYSSSDSTIARASLRTMTKNARTHSCWLINSLSPHVTASPLNQVPYISLLGVMEPGTFLGLGASTYSLDTVRGR
ncbi:hypothetical protein EDC04DRAFT_1276294 [Pisolithus marmoratus]|nr:hypothetical protein EDC04DRAFT_1276294 [Pisolithus marmoratus]